MLSKEELYLQDTMPTWSDISLELYKDFSESCLFQKIFVFYFVNGSCIEIQFKEWAMKHLWAIQHINNIDKNKLFQKIEEGLTFETLANTRGKKKRLNDNSDRIRMFACIYSILKKGDMFYVQQGQLKNSDVKVEYIRSKVIGGKGVNIGMRFEEGVYVPLTLLIDRAINPKKTIKGLIPLKIFKLEILERGTIQEEVFYKYYTVIEAERILNIKKSVRIPICFRKNTYSERLKRIKLKHSSYKR